ncbi:hypothetical protein [Pseudomonas phage pPA-3099-2aT.3]|nr:hypothetical protein [Pseudomonas phage pPA-3099-2aT.3]
MWVGGQAGGPHTPTNMVRGLGLVPGSRFLLLNRRTRMSEFNIKHFDSCSANYPEKPAGEPARAVTAVDLGDGHVALHCNDCGAHVVMTVQSPDANVERNRQELLSRSIVGLKKYGVTTEREDLNLGQWVQHAIEEVLDLANYLQALKTNIDSEEHRIRKAFLEGFQMRGEADSASPNGCVWRSPEEAWVNSDAEEEFRAVMRKQAGS